MEFIGKELIVLSSEKILYMMYSFFVFGGLMVKSEGVRR
jgi:hypothetical protein